MFIIGGTIYIVRAFDGHALNRTAGQLAGQFDVSGSAATGLSLRLDLRNRSRQTSLPSPFRLEIMCFWMVPPPLSENHR